MSLTLNEVAAAQAELGHADPQTVVTWALSRWGKQCGIAFSGAEDVMLIDLAMASGHPFSVFTLDTGRLHPETYRYIERVRSHYGIEIAVVMPEAESVEALVRRKGLFSFYEDGHAECCQVRKVDPLERVLDGFQAWMTGQRRDQSQTRSELAVMHVDSRFSGDGASLIKFNPLANQTYDQVHDYLKQRGIPRSPLHDAGFRSIGCAPCTRAVRPGQHEREGRWWWENADKKECGLHWDKPVDNSAT